MATLPAHIKDQIYTYVQNYQRGDMYVLTPFALAQRALGVVAAGTEWNSPQFALAAAQIANQARDSVNTGRGIEANPEQTVDPNRLPREYGPDLDAGQARFRVRVEGTIPGTTTRYNTVATVFSTGPMTGEEIENAALECVRTQACGPPPPSWIPTASWEWKTTVISAARGA